MEEKTHKSKMTRAHESHNVALSSPTVFIR